MWAILLKWLGGGVLDRILKTVDNTVDNQTEREKARTVAVQEYVKAQASILTGPGYWFPLFFIIPLGLWFASICIYSMLFCQRCVFPQVWSIAALPPPLDEWAGVIITSLFIGASGVKIMSNWRR
jgi:hypothetical protein